MAIQIKRAVKHESKLRMAIMGPSGSGKTMTSLILASDLAGDQGVIVIDTERGSASKYADAFAFDVIELDSFSPESYIEAIHAAEQGGYGVLVIDSISHEWAGPGGVLEIVDAVTRRSQHKNSFLSWGEVTPRHNKFIDAITGSRLHVIVTMRSKQEYALDKDERTGKTSPRKIGMAPIQRDLFEYEMDVVAEMDIENVMSIHKSRCPALSGKVIAQPTAQVAETLKQWLAGAPPVQLPAEPEQEQDPITVRAEALRKRAAKLGYINKAYNDLVLEATKKTAQALQRQGRPTEGDLDKVENRIAEIEANEAKRVQLNAYAAEHDMEEDAHLVPDEKLDEALELQGAQKAS